MESLVPEFNSHRMARIEREMQQLGSKLRFLDKRLDEAGAFEWKGGLKRSPII